MCEKHVRKALENLDGVSAVSKVSHEEGIAVIEASEDLSDEAVKTAVEEAGYKVLG